MPITPLIADSERPQPSRENVFRPGEHGHFSGIGEVIDAARAANYPYFLVWDDWLYITPAKGSWADKACAVSELPNAPAAEESPTQKEAARKREKTINVLLVVLMAGALLFGISVRFPKTTTLSTMATTSAEIVPIDLGNGLFYFPVTGDEYTRALQKFHEDKERDTCQYQGLIFRERSSFPVGHIFYCPDIAVEAQKVTIP